MPMALLAGVWRRPRTTWTPTGLTASCRTTQTSSSPSACSSPPSRASSPGQTSPETWRWILDLKFLSRTTDICRIHQQRYRKGLCCLSSWLTYPMATSPCRLGVCSATEPAVSQKNSDSSKIGEWHNWIVNTFPASIYTYIGQCSVEVKFQIRFTRMPACTTTSQSRLSSCLFSRIVQIRPMLTGTSLLPLCKLGIIKKLNNTIVD